MGIWEPYNRGPVENLIVFGKDGKPFNGTMDDWEEQYHSMIAGFRNKISGVVILINYDGEIVGRGGT